MPSMYPLVGSPGSASASGPSNSVAAVLPGGKLELCANGDIVKPASPSSHTCRNSGTAILNASAIRGAYVVCENSSPTKYFGIVPLGSIGSPMHIPPGGIIGSQFGSVIGSQFGGGSTLHAPSARLVVTRPIPSP